jgi:membrane protease YdiL (CAAX protease family)
MPEGAHMTVVAAVAVSRARAGALTALGLVGLALAVTLRVRVAGVAGAASVPAGFTFGLVLVALAAAVGLRLPRPTVATILAGTAAAAVLCVPVVIHRLAPGPDAVADPGAWPLWAAGVTFVAVAEEALLRGALYDRLVVFVPGRTAGPAAAIAVTAVAFALLHAPVYGWRVVPLDLAVGVWLGILRHVSGSFAAPAVAHTLADLAGWWLR